MVLVLVVLVLAVLVLVVLLVVVLDGDDGASVAGASGARRWCWC